MHRLEEDADTFLKRLAEERNAAVRERDTALVDKELLCGERDRLLVENDRYVCMHACVCVNVYVYVDYACICM